MNTNLATINTEAIDENRKEKICLIEDIIKLKRLLFGFGIERHRDVIDEPEKVFDWLYDMDMEDLTLKYANYSASASFKARELAGFASDEHPFKPGHEL